MTTLLNWVINGVLVFWAWVWYRAFTFTFTFTVLQVRLPAKVERWMIRQSTGSVGGYEMGKVGLFDRR